MKYNLLCFQISDGLIIFLNKHDYQVLTSLMKENKRYKRLKTAKWISIRKLVPGLLLTVRSAGLISLSHAMRPGLQIRHFWVAKSLFLTITFNQKKLDKTFCF